MIRFITQILDHRQFFGNHLRGNLLQHLAPGGLVRQCRNNDFAVFLFIAGAHPHTAMPGPVSLEQFCPGCDNFRTGWKIGPLNNLAEILHRAFRFFQQQHGCFGNLIQIMWRNIRCHTHGDTGCTVQQDIRQACRQ